MSKCLLLLKELTKNASSPEPSKPSKASAGPLPSLTFEGFESARGSGSRIKSGVEGATWSVGTKCPCMGSEFLLDKTQG
jgi:hypothetical protein